VHFKVSYLWFHFQYSPLVSCFDAHNKIYAGLVGSTPLCLCYSCQWMTFIDLEVRGCCSLEQKGLPYECSKKQPIHEMRLEEGKGNRGRVFLFTFRTRHWDSMKDPGVHVTNLWNTSPWVPVSVHFICCFSWQFHIITTEMELITRDILQEDLQLEMHVGTFKVNIPHKFWAISITRSQTKIIYSILSLLY